MMLWLRLRRLKFKGLSIQGKVVFVNIACLAQPAKQLLLSMVCDGKTDARFPALHLGVYTATNGGDRALAIGE